MASFEVLNQQGKKVGDITLSDSVWGAEVKSQLLWLIVKAQLAARRAGTNKTKTRREVRGGGKKPFRQKGTGWARQGSIRAPNHVGGGIAHGPKPRSYEMSVPKKMRRLALLSALSLRAGEKKVVFVDNMDLPEIKTNRVAKMMVALGARKALIIEDSSNGNLLLSTRNLANHKWLPLKAINVYDILRHDTLVMDIEIAKQLDAWLAQPVR